MPKLFQINITANWGSTGKIAETIGMAAMANGWESYIAYGRWCNPSQSHLIRIGSKLDTYLHYGEQRIRDNEGLCSRFATKRIIRTIEDIKPDIVQLHNIHDHYLNYRLLFEYLNQTDIKVVWTFHDCWAMTGHCFHFVSADCNRWKTGCHDCPLKNIFPKTFMDRSKKNWQMKRQMFTSCKNLTVVACSQWISDFVCESYLKDKRVEVLHNGVDLNIFKPDKKIRDNADSKFKILAVSSVWYKEKGEFDVYKLRELLDEAEYDIFMVGLSSEQAKHLPRGICGIQRTENIQELVRLYNDADVLINPTYHDTFPTINLEALASGTPVITYKTGGSPETIDNETGIVIEQGDIQAMADAIKRMKDLPLSSAACRQRAEMNFDKNKCFKKYIELYNDLLTE